MPQKKSPSILFITTGHPITNPRLIKEAESASAAGFSVHIVCSSYMPMLVEFDRKLKEEHPDWRFHRVDWTGSTIQSKFRRVVMRLRQAICTRLSNSFRSESVVFRAFFRPGPELVSLAMKVKTADLAIAHNLGALPVAGRWATKWKKPFGFDAEDYHAGESKGSPVSLSVRFTKFLEHYWIPKAAYLTGASPLISKRYRNRMPAITMATIHNVFSNRFLAPPPQPWQPGSPLVLCWFSQTIGPERGLENLLSAIAQFPGKSIHLLLIGNLPPVFQNWFEHSLTESKVDRDQITISGMVYPDELFTICSSAHIGLTLEDPTIENRDMCLTNKLFTYLLCGCAVVATKTRAQRQFLDENPGIGKLVTAGSTQSVGDAIREWYVNPADLHRARETAYQAAKSRWNWEQEQETWLQAVRPLLPE